MLGVKVGIVTVVCFPLFSCWRGPIVELGAEPQNFSAFWPFPAVAPPAARHVQGQQLRPGGSLGAAVHHGSAGGCDRGSAGHQQLHLHPGSCFVKLWLWSKNGKMDFFWIFCILNILHLYFGNYWIYWRQIEHQSVWRSRPLKHGLRVKVWSQGAQVSMFQLVGWDPESPRFPARLFHSSVASFLTASGNAFPVSVLRRGLLSQSEYYEYIYITVILILILLNINITTKTKPAISSQVVWFKPHKLQNSHLCISQLLDLWQHFRDENSIVKALKLEFRIVGGLRHLSHFNLKRVFTGFYLFVLLCIYTMYYN